MKYTTIALLILSLIAFSEAKSKKAMLIFDEADRLIDKDNIHNNYPNLL